LERRVRDHSTLVDSGFGLHDARIGCQHIGVAVRDPLGEASRISEE
jgi:hypothetical protein